jgi:hypothetical protein
MEDPRCTKSRTESCLEMRKASWIDIFDPSWHTALNERFDARSEYSSTEYTEPNRERARIDKLLPSMGPHSRIEMELPVVTLPNTLTLEPHRSTFRNDNDDPSCKKSRTENADPSRAPDRRESDDPQYVASIIDIFPAHLTDSNTLRTEPQFAKLRKLKALPTFQNDCTLIADPRRYVERTEQEEPQFAKSNKLSVAP